ncbi:MAG: hypothetical protein U0289_16600 [Cyclobacteriaceae bacterium]|jgi:hypothetical protein|nr:hypothetical protein [Cytophagales bacterium]HNP77094.1 hypothetical protein [Cyclobacteriaceae bacterium]HQQ83471.1 hypothetical protein [Cyclobacteriaceae bacterium]
MGFIKDLFSGGSSELVNSVGKVLDKVVTTKAEKMQLEMEMKKAERQFELDMANLSLEERKAMLGDVASARASNAAVETSATASRLSKNVSAFLALGGTLLCFALFAWLMFGEWKKPDDTDKKEIILYVLGVLSGILSQIYSYYFGSSQGSATKTDIISSMHQNLRNEKS